MRNLHLIDVSNTMDRDEGGSTDSTNDVFMLRMVDMIDIGVGRGSHTIFDGLQKLWDEIFHRLERKVFQHSLHILVNGSLFEQGVFFSGNGGSKLRFRVTEFFDALHQLRQGLGTAVKHFLKLHSSEIEQDS